MIKVTKILFLLVGCIFPIFIGSMHTYVHFKELLTPEIRDFLQREFVILGESQQLWNTWGVVSFMMGLSFIVIGLLNISILRSIAKSETLPFLPIVAMLLYQLGVTYVGSEYNAAFQFYGGIFGIIVISLCLILTLILKSKKA